MNAEVDNFEDKPYATSLNLETKPKVYRRVRRQHKTRREILLLLTGKKIIEYNVNDNPY